MIRDGRSTDQLLDESDKCLAKLRKLFKARKNRDKTITTLTDLHLMIAAIAQRVGEVEFSSAPVAVEDDEDQHEYEPLSMADLLPSEADEAEDHVAAEAGKTAREFRLFYFRQFLDYLTKGAKQVDEVSSRVIAIVRRVRPHTLTQLGISQVDVSRKLNEPRGTTNAREKRVVEKPLKANKTRGFQVAGGTKSHSHRLACAKAQKGNKSRKTGELRKRGLD